jgi:hypothetical protein
MEPGARRIVCRGARAAEARLLAEVERWRPRSPDEAAMPVRVLVPSRSLRLHLASRLVDRFGCVAGVVVQTVHGAALEILERNDECPMPGDTLFELLVRRLVGREDDLSGELAAYEDGADATVSVVRDLLDAGFEPSLTEAVLERLEASGSGLAEPRLRRAAALVRLAARVAAGLDAVGAVRTGQAPIVAARHVNKNPDRSWPTRAVFVHGFADVTGAVSELLLAMLRTWPGAVLVDRPPDPCDLASDDPGAAYLERLEIALGGLAVENDPDHPVAPEVVRVAAPNREAETRTIAAHVRALLDEGAPAESIGVVARDPERHVGGLRRWFERLGVPYSGVGVTVTGGEARRRVHRLIELLGAGADCPLAAWLEALRPRAGLGDLRLGLRLLGAVRVVDVAGIALHALPEGGVELPFVDVDEEGEQPRDAPTPRRLPESEVAHAVAAASQLSAALGAADAPGTATVHRERTVAVVTALGWPMDDPARSTIEAACDTIVDELPPSMELDAGEWRTLVSGRLRSAGEGPVGGRGGGVQLLSVMEARGRTFDTLCMIGLERGSFPRTVAEDPLLPDALRGGVAADLLPFLPVKTRGAHEERYLFAQLLASAPRVICTWATRDLGTTLSASPFVDRMAFTDVGRADPPIPLQPDDRSIAWPMVRTAVEHGVMAARSTGAEGLPAYLESALDEGWSVAGVTPRFGTSTPAAARSDVLIQAESPADGPLPGPWAGLVGNVVDTGDRPLWVTSLERTAACPWQVFITDRLGVAPMPDPGHGIPDVDALLVGRVVHRVLQRMVDDAVGERVETVARASTRSPAEVPWPSASRLAALVEEAAQRAVRDAGLAAYGLAELVSARALPVLDVARAVVFHGADRMVGVLGAEVRGEAEDPRLPVPVRFRADRVDRGPDGLLLVDYKTGKPPSTAVNEDTRRRHVLRAVRDGRLMQALVYALEAGGGERVGTGTYVHLRPDLDPSDDPARVVALRSDDTEAVQGFLEAVAAVVSARRTGAMFPRVVEATRPRDRPDHCRWCHVADACRRDDSAFRHRLVTWMDSREPPLGAAEHAAWALWWLGVAERS